MNWLWNIWKLLPCARRLASAQKEWQKQSDLFSENRLRVLRNKWPWPADNPSKKKRSRRSQFNNAAVQEPLSKATDSLLRNQQSTPAVVETIDRDNGLLNNLKFFVEARQLAAARFDSSDYSVWNSERGYSELAFRARTLGWNGAGSLWGLLTWALVSDEDCAGPRRNVGVPRALAAVRQVIEERETQVGLAYIAGRYRGVS